ncbi:MAG: AAA family ATPase [Gemmatimonadaceae bacterium]
MDFLSQLHLQLLGVATAESRLSAGDRRLSKGKPVALLAYLSLAPGRRASRERLASLLWSDGSSDAARQNLRQTIWYIKRRLGDILAADDSAVWLEHPPVSDVATFTEAAAQERYTDALAAYAGDFIPDFAAPGAADFEDWADLERRRLRAIYIGCVEAVVRQSLSAGKAADALAVAKRARELAPAEPSSWRILLECLIAARDTIGVAAAVAQIDAEVEREDLDPDPAMRALLRTAKRLVGGAEVEPVSADVADRELVPDLIGREEEFRTLVDAWETARRGKGRTMLLTGAAGLGKTRLLKDFEARLTSARGRSISVGAHPGNRTIASSLAAQIAEALSALPGAAAVSPGSASVLVGLSPLIASAFPGAEPDRASGEEALRRRASALGELVTVLAETNAIAILIDDAHWADGESLRLIGALRARVENAKALMVVAGRIPDDLRLHIGGVEEVALRPLDVAGVAEFLGRLASLPTEPWSRGFVPRLHEVTQGIPLLLIEPLQRLVEAGELTRTDGTWTAPRGDLLATTLPMGSALQARLQSLDERDRIALLRLSTFGRPVSRVLLKGDERVPDWDVALAELERRSFIARTERQLTVWHDEVARGVLDLAQPSDRIEAHGWVSDTLLSFAESTSDHALAALHAARAADDARLNKVWLTALEHIRRAGDTRPIDQIAAEVLPTELNATGAQRAVRSTPWRLRFTRRARALAAAVAVLMTATAAASMFSGRSDQLVRIAFANESDSSSVWVVEIDPSAPWVEGEALKVGRVEMTGPLSVLRLRSSAHPDRRPDRWLATVKFMDAGGDDVAFIDASGALTRIASDSADDVGPIPAPDGSGLVFSTRRFDRAEHQSEVVHYEYDTGELTRLTDSPEDEEAVSWSPDGTRLTFARRFVVQERDTETCVVHRDGAAERCAWVGLPPGSAPIAWLNDKTLLVGIPAARTVYRVDTETGEAVYFGRAPGGVRRLEGTNLLLHNYYDPQSQEQVLALATFAEPLARRPVALDGRRFAATRVVVLDGQLRAPHLDRFAFEERELRVSLESGAAVRVSGVNSEGIEVPIRALRFEGADTSVVRVQSDGLVSPVSIGQTWIRVTAGGWRKDSVHVTITAGKSRARVTETWSDGIGSFWTPFGVPRPRVRRVGGVRALEPNGDGKYASGVYQRQPMPTADGVGVEMRFRTPIVRNKLDRLGVSFSESGDSAQFSRWDHATTSPPIGPSICSCSFPWGEGGAAFKRIAVSSATGEIKYGAGPPPADLYADVWHTVRLQLTPDGRCTLYLDGNLVARTDGPARVPPTVRLMILGSSGPKPVVVGNVEVWEGVRLVGGR